VGLDLGLGRCCGRIPINDTRGLSRDSKRVTGSTLAAMCARKRPSTRARAADALTASGERRPRRRAVGRSEERRRLALWFTRVVSRWLAWVEFRSTTLASRLGTVNGQEPPEVWLPSAMREKRQNQAGLGTSRSLWAISSIDTSRKVRTLALFTKRAGRYISQTQASPMETS
jgi:hypothetical protein